MVRQKHLSQSQDKQKKDKLSQSSAHGPRHQIISYIDHKVGIDIIKKLKFITIQNLAKQTNVKISTANNFILKMLKEGIIKKAGGYSGHYIYKPIL